MPARVFAASAAIVCLACACPSTASAEVFVTRSGNALNLTQAGVRARAIVEHFADDSRNGVRIRQVAFGDPSIRDEPDDATCDHNPTFNDVVCNFIPISLSILGGPTDDEFIVGGSNQGCATAAGTPVVADLRGGDDTLRARTECAGTQSGINRLHPQFEVDGGDGRDTLSGGGLADDLEGDSADDTLTGGAGKDSLDGGEGRDQLNGSAGDDKMFAAERVLAPDVLDGGSGTDTVLYVGVFTSVGPRSFTVTLDGAANDGAAGEGDKLVQVENVETGPANDTLTGSDGPNVLNGHGGNDEIVGRGGADTLVGEGGDDLIEPRDSPAVKDVVSCGNGFDTVIADLLDVVKTTVAVGQPVVAGPECERVERFAVDDGPPAQVVSRSVRIAPNGSLSLRLACPRRARVTCRGRIRLVDARRRGRTLASARYVASRGRRSAPVRLRLSRKEVRGVRAAGLVRTVTRERGVSKKGPRSAINTLRVRRG